MRILVTGAAGNIGRKLVDHLRAECAGYDLVCLDVVKCAPYTDMSHDLSKWDESWTERFAGVDVVVHLAADRYPTADF
jgi:nucleoside-diphosphate-sugar epimerase